MKKFAENFAALVKVKTIVTFVVIAVFAVLALRGDISPDNVMNVVIAVIAFYFGTQHEKGNTAQTASDHSCPFMNLAELDGSIEGGETIEPETDINERAE